MTATQTEWVARAPVREVPRVYHLNLVEEGGPVWRDYLAFRRYLRSHPEEARDEARFEVLVGIDNVAARP